MAAPSRWLAWLPARIEPRLRLFVFPHAGSGAAPYRAWRAHLPPDVEAALVQLPGRESRLAEPPLTRMRDLVDRLVPAIQEEVAARPSVFFGHSMGAHLAYETARRLRALGLPGPRRLLVSGNRAPTLPYPRPRIAHEGDARILAEFHRLGGTPPEILQHEELMALLRPILRADLEVCETYAHEPAPGGGPPLDVPITAYGGADDPDVPPAALEAWARETSGGFRMRAFDGGHFFLMREAREAFFADLAGELGEAMREIDAGGHGDPMARPRHDRDSFS